MGMAKHSKTHSDDHQKSKAKWFVIGGIVGVLLLIFAVYWTFASPTVPAQLLVHSGEVQVDTGKGFVPVTGQLKLSELDKIKTLAGEASVILYESVVIDLEPNTEIAIDALTKKHPRITQTAGSTWNKFAKITGVETLEITTPDTVATVRGTFFGLRNNRMLLSNGRVDWKAGGSSMSFNGLSKGTFQGGSMKRGQVSADEVEEINRRREKVIQRLKKLRELEVKKHKTIVKLIQKRYGWDVPEINRRLEELDNNQANLDEIEKQAPIKLAAAYKLKRFTQEIRAIKQLPPPQVTGGGASQGTGQGAPAQCPGGEWCCCQYGHPDCGDGYECRQWIVSGKQYFGVCVKKGANPGVPLQLHSSQQPYCGK